MRLNTWKQVERIFCDNCGNEALGTRYMKGGNDYCSNCRPWTFKDIKKGYAIGQIKEQPFFCNQSL